ncbi:hypothetical protein [Phenylobacterium conjunctum]|uniref:Uncharacterized protein n=1 Tax=Phenylobacterium conjunctum TaxID=1298959 RepID=A0ABW3T2Y5_9CAUL
MAAAESYEAEVRAILSVIGPVQAEPFLSSGHAERFWRMTWMALAAHEIDEFDAIDSARLRIDLHYDYPSRISRA